MADHTSKSDPSFRRTQLSAALFVAGAITATLAIGTGAQLGVAQMQVLPSVPGGAWSLTFGLLLLQVLNGFFVAGETSVALLRPMHVKLLKEKGEKRGVLLQKLLDRQPTHAAACQLGSRLTHVVILFIALMLAVSCTPLFAGWFGWDPASFWTVVLIAGILVIFPVLPLTLTVEHGFRTYSVVHPHGVALRLFRFISATTALLAWPAHGYTGFAKLISARLSKAELAVANQTEAEIKTLVESAEESGEIEAEEKKLLHSVFDFTDTVAREVMTPRVDLDALPISSDPNDVMRLIHESGHSRIPLYDGTDDQIIGIIHAKDLLITMLGGKAPNLRALMRPAYFVPEGKNLHDLLAEMKSHRTQMAVVQDEFGGTAGVVTIEDIVEELVGDIVDEYDVEDPDLVPVESGWSVDGRMHLDDLTNEIGATFDSEEFDTVGGLVFGAFGRQPKLRESIDIEGHRFTVLHTDGRRVNRLMVERLVGERDENEFLL